jgi:hypothetical protein
MPSDEVSEEEKLVRRWYDHKSRLMEQSLGKEHGMVMHAIVPFYLGGGLDLYYYPHGLQGTAIATKELTELPNQGSSNNIYQSYEMVMFTRRELDLGLANDEWTPFGWMHSTINSILQPLARYSADASLNPNETCEFPEDFDRIGGKCLIFDGFARYNDAIAKDFGLLLVIDIFRSEMEYAREAGGSELIEMLKEKGCYPYSDLDRKPLI